jgi:hypothetical protein
LKFTPVLAALATVTTVIGPVRAPLGARATMLVSLQLEGVAAVPLNATVLVPRVDRQSELVIVMDAPTGTATGESPRCLVLLRRRQAPAHSATALG